MGIDELKQQIKEYIKTNGNGEITGQVLQDQLLAMIDTLSESVGGMDYVTINRRFSDSEFRYYGQVSVADYDKLYDAIVNNKALAVVWTERNAIYAMTMLGKKSTYVENTSIHIECIAIQYTTGNTFGYNGYGFEPLYLTLTRSHESGGIIEDPMESEGQFQFLNSGDGNKYLADNGEYKEITSVRELYISAGAVYNEQTGFYELNGLTDITEEQMRVIYNSYIMNLPNDATALFADFRGRTNIPFNGNPGSWVSSVIMKFMCANTSMEVFAVGANGPQSYCTTNNANSMFYNCSNMREIVGSLNLIDISNDNNVANIFKNCGKLRKANIKNLKVNLSFANSPFISLESLQYLITNAANTSPITVTVHADVYNKIQDELQTDWHALIEAGTAKQITFATA